MTLQLPAICDECGAVFPSGFSVMDGTVINCKSGPCPVCGGIGSVPDGTYQTVGDVVRLLAGPQKTVEQLRRIFAVVENARQLAKQPEMATQIIKSEAPELVSIAESLPKTRNELYLFLTVILMAIGTIIAAAALFKDQGPTEEEVRRLIDRSIEEAFRESQRIEQQKPSRSEPKPLQST